MSHEYLLSQNITAQLLTWGSVFKKKCAFTFQETFLLNGNQSTNQSHRTQYSGNVFQR